MRAWEGRKKKFVASSTRFLKKRRSRTFSTTYTFSKPSNAAWTHLREVSSWSRTTSKNGCQSGLASKVD